MRIVLLDKIASFLHTSRIDSYHYAMFHGVCRRQDANDHLLNAVNHRSSSMLELVVNDYRINKITEPGLNLVAIEDVASLLEHHYHIQSIDVAIKEVATIEYSEGSMKHWDDPKYKDTGGTPQTILRRAARKGELAWKGPRLKEILPYDGELLGEEKPMDAFQRSIFLKERGEHGELCGTRQALEEYGLLWSDGMHCFREDIFNELDKFIHKDYFAIHKIEL